MQNQMLERYIGPNIVQIAHNPDHNFQVEYKVHEFVKGELVAINTIILETQISKFLINILKDVELIKKMKKSINHACSESAQFDENSDRDKLIDEIWEHVDRKFSEYKSILSIFFASIAYNFSKEIN